MISWLSAGLDATLQQRIKEVIFIALLEVIIAVSALVYDTFILPNFYTLKSAWLQLLWICVIHPLYFELTTSAIVRKALHRQVELGRLDIVKFLPVMHMNVHQVLQVSIEPTKILALSLMLYRFGKLFWTSTVLWRDLFVERVWRRQLSYYYDNYRRFEHTKIISLAVMTEIVLDNAAVLAAPFMLWAMYHQPIFMSVVPNTFYNDGGTYPVKTLSP